MEELFKKYTAAFDAFDAEAIAGIYRLPCAIVDADGVQTFSEQSELVKKFAANCEAMRGLGYQNVQFNILNRQPLGDNAMAVTIGWRVNSRDSSIDFRTLYICHQVNHVWYIFNANVYPGSLQLTNGS